MDCYERLNSQTINQVDVWDPEFLTVSWNWLSQVLMTTDWSEIGEDSLMTLLPLTQDILVTLVTQKVCPLYQQLKSSHFFEQMLHKPCLQNGSYKT